MAFIARACVLGVACGFVLAGCGRLGFESHRGADLGPLADASTDLDVGDLSTLVDSAIPEDARADADGDVDLGMVAPPGVVFVPSTALSISESGAPTIVAVRLASQPSAPVTFTLSVDDATAAEVTPGSLTFTASNWNVDQQLSVIGVEDARADGDQPFNIVTSNAASLDLTYGGFDVPDIAGVTADDDVATVVVSPTSGLSTTEAGGTATFTVALTSEPAADVTISISSSAPSEGGVSPSSLTFTSLDWSSPQIVTVSGLDDAVRDGDFAYSVITANAVSSDLSYSAMDVPDVSLTNIDDDIPNILVTPSSGLITSESSGTDSFDVVLTTEPTSDVQISLASSNLAEGTIDLASLTFTSANWNVPQTITITGVDDPFDDGDRAYSVITSTSTSSDPGYSGLDAADVSVTNTNDDFASVVVTPTTGLITTERGVTATFTVVLAVPPTASVIITLTSDNPMEGTVSPALLSFTGANWNVPRTVTVTGVNDALFDGYVPYNIVTSAAVSGDPGYAGLPVADVALTNRNIMRYIKASNPDAYDFFGYSCAISDDGNTFAIGAFGEASAATGINGNQTSNAAPTSGAVYVFVRSAGTWVQQAYIKASSVFIGGYFGAFSVSLSANGNSLAVGASGVNNNAGSAFVFTRAAGTWSQQAFIQAANAEDNDVFGGSVALSGDGTTLAVGALGDDSASPGINGNEFDNSANNAGATFVFVLSAGVWTQQAYIKASDPDADDTCSQDIELAADGNTLAVGCRWDASSATGINGDATDNSAGQAGAVFVYSRSGVVWTQQAYIKASNTQAVDEFGLWLSLSADGNTLAVGGTNEASRATGIDGDQSDNSMPSAGAVYVFARGGTFWSQQAYIKASNTSPGASFSRPSLSRDGNVLAIGAAGENSNAQGIGGDQTNTSAMYAGAVYVFGRVGVTWHQEAYVKATNTDANDNFGYPIALSGDGRTLLACSTIEASNASGIDGNAADNSLMRAGAAYVFE